MADESIALVTGTNKGIGLEVARELGRLGIPVTVVARDVARGVQAVASVGGMGSSATLSSST